MFAPAPLSSVAVGKEEEEEEEIDEEEVVEEEEEEGETWIVKGVWMVWVR